MKFSDRLKGLREKNDMTQEQLAKVSGVSPNPCTNFLNVLSHLESFALHFYMDSNPH